MLTNLCFRSHLASVETPYYGRGSPVPTWHAPRLSHVIHSPTRVPRPVQTMVLRIRCDPRQATGTAFPGHATCQHSLRQLAFGSPLEPAASPPLPGWFTLLRGISRGELKTIAMSRATGCSEAARVRRIDSFIMLTKVRNRTHTEQGEG